MWKTRKSTVSARALIHDFVAVVRNLFAVRMQIVIFQALICYHFEEYCSQFMKTPNLESQKI